MGKEKHPYFPIYMDFTNTEFLAIGSGNELNDAVSRLAGFTADLCVIAQKPSAELEQMEAAGKIRLIRKAYDREDLYGADYVIAQTEDHEIDKEIYAACKCLGITVHICGDPERCDFFFDQARAEQVQADKAHTEQTQADKAHTVQAQEVQAQTDQILMKQPLAEQEVPRMHVRIYTDGAARGNPDGPGGYGTVLEFTDSQGNLHVREMSQGYLKTTNNRMELMAAIAGLEALKKPCTVELYSDSKYLTDAFNQHWIEGWIKKGWKRGGNEPVKNISLWKRLLKAAQPHQVTYIWVKGHNGHPQNERCDQLATASADSLDLIDDDLGE